MVLSKTSDGEPACANTPPPAWFGSCQQQSKRHGGVVEAVVGGHRLRAGRPEHPSHESAASLPSVATSAAPSTGCAEPTCASIPQSALAAAITEGGSWAGEGGRHLRASRPAHPGHESAASTTHVASPAAPSARQLRRTNLRKRTAVSPADGNQTGRERGWGQGDGRLRGVSWLGRTKRPGVEWRGEARPNRGGSSSQTRRQSRRAAGRHGRRA